MADCHEKAKMLGHIFEKVMPSEGAKKRERIQKAAKSVKRGRPKKVVSLMAGIMTDLQTLQTSRFFKDQLQKRAEDIKSAFDKISELGPSLEDGHDTSSHRFRTSECQHGKRCAVQLQSEWQEEQDVQRTHPKFWKGHGFRFRFE